MVRLIIDHLAARFLSRAGQRVDFKAPTGEPALVPHDSVSWRIFKNPVTVFIGGVSAVILEFADPRVREGVWRHSTFRSDPVTRLARTGLAAMVTVYAARSESKRMIAGVNRMHARVAGETAGGLAYSAADPMLLDWVHGTAAFGFIEAYSAYAAPLGFVDKARAYAEGRPAALLYGATAAPTDPLGFDAMLAARLPLLEASPVVAEFLEIMRSAPILPRPARPLQSMLVRAAVALTPLPVRTRLKLGSKAGLRRGEYRLVRVAARMADRIVLPSAPPAEACQRLGLPTDHLYRGAASAGAFAPPR